METPAVSIIIPFFNVEDYLEQCFASIYEVSSTLIEVILVNDGSTDRSREIAEKYKAMYPDITKLVNKESEGVSVARNVGLAQATGKWIAFLDSDDFVNSEAFERIVRYALITTADIVAYDGYRFVEETKATLPLYSVKNPFEDKGQVKGQDYISTMINMNMTNIVTIWDKIYRNATLKRLDIKFIDGIVHEDVAFTFDVLLSDLKLEFLPEKVVYYRQRAGSIMYTESPLKIQSKIFLIDYLLDSYSEKNLDDPILNDYLVFTAKEVIKGGGKINPSTLEKLNCKRLSLKKKIILFTLHLLNLKKPQSN